MADKKLVVVSLDAMGLLIILNCNRIACHQTSIGIVKMSKQHRYMKLPMIMAWRRLLFMAGNCKQQDWLQPCGNLFQPNLDWFL